ncbi:MAG TPA: hypothetical protein VLH56_01635 [Dissulfurispiraceae bacterium]|nr:hypothetical protein [Dissulfurispiraceae bacterium]
MAPTLPEVFRKAVSTAAVFPLIAFCQAEAVKKVDIVEQQFFVSEQVMSATLGSAKFEGNEFDYNDNWLRPIPELTRQINVVNELVDLGAIVFAGSRDVTAEEANIMRQYYRSKLRKL